MHYNVDLRFLVPLFISFFFHFFQTLPQGGDTGNSRDLWDSVECLIMWKTTLPILAFFLLFLAVSIKLPLTLSLSVHPIRLQLGKLYLSVLLALTMLSSILFPMALFCSVYFVCSCIFMASWPRSLAQSFKRWLLSLPTFVVTPDPAGPSTYVEHSASEASTVLGTFDECSWGEISTGLRAFDEQFGIEVNYEHENLAVIYGHA